MRKSIANPGMHLEIECPGNGTLSSNLSLSAILQGVWGMFPEPLAAFFRHDFSPSDAAPTPQILKLVFIDWKHSIS